MRNVGSSRRPQRGDRLELLAGLRADLKNRSAARRFRFALVLVVCTTMAGCAEETGPQFANEPAPTRPATAMPAVATPILVHATPVAATPVSVADLLTTRGAPSRLYLTTSDVIWTISSVGEAKVIYQSPPEERIVAIDAAPGGDRVAAVLSRDLEGTATDVAIIDPSGQIVTRHNDLGAALATPSPDGGSPAAAAIDWSPQADRALVSFVNGAILDIPIGSDGVRTLLPPSGSAGSVVSPRWSPTGESVAYVAADSDGLARTLRVLDVNDGAVRDVVTPPKGRFVVDYAWMPDGVSLLFTEGGELGGAVTGIDLWRIDADGENRELIVSAGTVAPVARITNVEPSPDGRRVAYSVLVPGDSDPRVDSVWVRDLGSRLGFRIQVPSVAAIDDITWTDRGVAIDVTTDAGSGRPPTQALLHVGQDGIVSALWATSIAAGTPVSATPAASPAID